MIIVTGGAGFIGNGIIWGLNQAGYRDILVVDNLGKTSKWQNLNERNYRDYLHKDEFFPWLKKYGPSEQIEAIFHMGACSATTETDVDYLYKNNVHYSMQLFDYCARHRIPFFYASSAATYGMGEHGFTDQFSDGLRPINPYGFSKHKFDEWALVQSVAPEHWAGFKFFNVYGPGESHKGSMRSLVCKALPQIQETGQLKLFKSHKEGYEDGEQKRDFVYIKDVVKALLHFFFSTKHESWTFVPGIYNIGTGEARSFADLGRGVFSALGTEENFEFIDMPISIRNQYQYFTQADLGKLRSSGYFQEPFTSLEEGIRDYVQNYLLEGKIAL